MKIVVFNAKGGSGKSTLAVTLAVLLDAQLVDLDESQVARRAIERRKGWDPKSRHVVTDCPGEISVGLSEAVRDADLVLIPVMCGFNDFVVLPQSVKFVRAHATGKVGFVCTAVDARSGDLTTLIARLAGYGYPIVGVLAYLSAYKRAAVTGQIASEVSKKAQADCEHLVKSIQELFDEKA